MSDDGHRGQHVGSPHYCRSVEISRRSAWRCQWAHRVLSGDARGGSTPCPGNGWTQAKLESRGFKPQKPTFVDQTAGTHRTCAQGRTETCL